MSKKKEVILLAEHGWQGMRHCALDFAQKGYQVTVLIKGHPSRDVRKFISKKSNIRNYFIPIKFFSILYPFVLFYKKYFGKVQHVIYQTSKAEKIVIFLSFTEERKKIKDLLSSPYYSFSHE